MKARFLFISSLTLLTACKQSKPSVALEETDTARVESVKAEVQKESVVEYNAVDAQTFGLFGKVQSVIVQSFLTSEVNGNLTEGSMTTESEMSFNQWGYVTKDEWGNEYGYDADGNFYRGNHIYTLLKRDKSGRIKEYIDEEPNTDNDENQKLSFVYDKTGRLKTVTQGGWTGHWKEQRSYEGGNLYPSKVITTADYEGGGESLRTTTYRYSQFDEKKNWIERICIISETEKDNTDSIEGRAIINEQITIQKRSIIYYE